MLQDSEVESLCEFSIQDINNLFLNKCNEIQCMEYNPKRIKKLQVKNVTKKILFIEVMVIIQRYATMH